MPLRLFIIFLLAFTFQSTLSSTNLLPVENSTETTAFEESEALELKFIQQFNAPSVVRSTSKVLRTKNKVFRSQNYFHEQVCYSITRLNSSRTGLGFFFIV